MLEGALEERLGLAMSHTIPPLFQGAISTFLSMLPLAFHDIKFVMKYFFGVFSVLVAVGLLTGLVLLPALLALLSPISDALSGTSRRSNARELENLCTSGRVKHGAFVDHQRKKHDRKG